MYQSDVSSLLFVLRRTFFVVFSHKFVNQFEKMDRSKSTSSASASNHKDIVCGQPFDALDVLEEIARLRRIPVELVKNQQEDAHELLSQLLNELHEEICSILYPNKSGDELSPPPVEPTTTTTLPNGEEKAEDWLQVGKKNRTHVLRSVSSSTKKRFAETKTNDVFQNELRKSLVAEIFAGKFRSTVHSAGNQKSVMHEPFFTLSLDIKVRRSKKQFLLSRRTNFQDPKITTLDDALIRFCEQSNVADYLDSKTRQQVRRRRSSVSPSTFLLRLQINTNKNMLIEQLPPILIIHLKCFLYDEADGTKKLMKLINYSINLTLPKSEENPFFRRLRSTFVSSSQVF